MGEISKTITIEVPTTILYDSIKRVYLSDYKEKYCSDFKMVKSRGRLKSALTKDIPNSELTFGASKWGAKAEVGFIFRPVGESACEVTINCKYKLVLELSVEQDIMGIIEGLLMLEKGYKARQ